MICMFSRVICALSLCLFPLLLIVAEPSDPHKDEQKTEVFSLDHKKIWNEMEILQGMKVTLQGILVQDTISKKQEIFDEAHRGMAVCILFNNILDAKLQTFLNNRQHDVVTVVGTVALGVNIWGPNTEGSHLKMDCPSIPAGCDGKIKQLYPIIIVELIK